MKNGPLFYCYSSLIRFWFMQIRGFVTSQSSHVKSQKIEYLCKYSGSKFCRVDVLQELLQCGYYVIRATYSSPDLYFLKTKNFLLQSLTDFLVPHSLTPTEWSTKANNASWRRQTLILPFEWREPEVYCVAMETSQWIYHGTLSWV